MDILIPILLVNTAKYPKPIPETCRPGSPSLFILDYIKNSKIHGKKLSIENSDIVLV